MASWPFLKGLKPSPVQDFDGDGIRRDSAGIRGLEGFDSLHLQHIGFVAMDLIIAVDCVSWPLFGA